MAILIALRGPGRYATTIFVILTDPTRAAFEREII